MAVAKAKLTVPMLMDRRTGPRVKSAGEVAMAARAERMTHKTTVVQKRQKKKKKKRRRRKEEKKRKQ